MEKQFELDTGKKVVTWTGKDGVDAAKRYVDAHPTETVYAWREPRIHLAVGVSPAQVIG